MKQRIDYFILFGWLFLQALSIWSIPVLPTLDGPMHLYTASLIQQIFFEEDPFLSNYIQVEWRIHTNVFCHYFMAVLLEVVSPVTAEKIFQTVYLLLLPVAAFYALSAIQKGGTYLLSFTFPLAANFLFHMGFYNFCFAFIPFLFGVGFWYRRRKRMSLGSGIVLLFLFCLTFLSHITSFYALIGLIGLGVAMMTISGLISALQQKQEKLKALRQVLIFRLLAPLFSLIPSCYLVLDFVGSYGTSAGYFQPKIELLNNLLVLDSLNSFRLPQEAVLLQFFFWILTASLSTMLIVRLIHPKLKDHDLFLIGGICFLVVYFTAPLHGAGGGMITTRMMLYPLYCFILWLAAAQVPDIVKHAVRVIGVFAALTLLHSRHERYSQISLLVEEYREVQEIIEPKSTLYPLNIDGSGFVEGAYLSPKISIFNHVSKYVASSVPSILDLTHSMANERHSPVRWKGDLWPLGQGILMELPGEVPKLNFDSISEKNFALGIDYILLWHEGYGGKFSEKGKKFIEQYPERYEQVFISKPQGKLVMHHDTSSK